MNEFLRETELYDQDQYIADQMRAPLENALRRAWDEGREPIIISHSMGTFISYDVLWRFAHRKTTGFKKYNSKRVKIFITMGSPLGDSTVRDLLFARHHQDHGKRQFPTNIDCWHNYACLGDVVAHQKNFDDIFYQPMRELKLFPSNKKFRSIDYVDLHNPFEVVTHSGNRNKEKRNPHKSYGYLAQPRLGSWISDYLLDRLR
jgi:pimeloyl-ACP methyl ester carboxylesterase